jgi:peroxiredoxin (alkyl hydroperoxide reductase subunit C)
MLAKEFEGRNFEEILRVIDALQFADKHEVATPVDWKIGDEVIIPPSISNEEAKKKFPQGWNEVRSYLQLTKVA